MKWPSNIVGYRLVREIGHGGMATVHLAVQESLDREVALKLLKPELAADPIASERFLREGRIAAKLVHRHIVGIHDVGVCSGQPYLAMEYLPNGSLTGIDPLPPAKVLTAVREVALALDHAHAQGVIHRDIKPENILCRADGSHALSDFGIARTIDHSAPMTQEGATIGTPHYMSPEQLQGQPVDGRSDLYSLGVVLHVLLTGQLPYRGADDWAIGVQHISAPLPELAPALARYQPLLHALMAKSPALRPRSGAELARRIEALQAGLASPATAPEPTRRAPLLPTANQALGGARSKLSQRTFPRRVSALLEGILELVRVAIDRRLAGTLDEFERDLFKAAEQARNNDLQKRGLDALHNCKRGRSLLMPRFMDGVEASLAALKDPPQHDQFIEGSRNVGALSLVENVVLDEGGTLNEIVGRTELHNSLALYLLGQRFGVIAGQAAFDAETLPIGPHAICRVFRDAAGCLDLGLEHRLQLYRQFDARVMHDIDPLYESVNAYLINQRVLPNLTYVPLRAKPSAQAERSAPAATPAAAPPASAAGAQPQSARPSPTPPEARPAATPPASAAGAPLYSVWPSPTAPSARQDVELFDLVQQLLAERRAMPDKQSADQPPVGSAPQRVASQQDLQSALGQLQSRAPTPVTDDGQPHAPLIADLKQDVLAQLRELMPQGEAPALAEEHAGTVELVGMLFDQIMKDVRPNSLASALLAKLQVPLLRLALGDKGFFTQKAHPARDLLNTLVESGASWTTEDEADPSMAQKMHLLVDRLGREFGGDPALFGRLLGDLKAHLQTQTRKAEAAERRHVEAARGKEKLELARIKAAEAIDAHLAGKRVPKFLHTLLAQSWSDVLALSLLRGGEQSDAYRRQLQVAGRLIEAAAGRRATRTAIGSAEAQGLKQEIEESLAQVGYYADDAQAIAQRLLAGGKPASRTKLAMKLPAHARLGQHVETPAPDGGSAPLDASEQACLDRLRQLPFRTWFTFNEQGEIVRRRMAWYSTLTGNCLFVNHRGQRVGEYSLTWLAREMQRGQVQVVEAEAKAESSVDRAWSGIVSSLRSSVGRGGQSGSSRRTS